MSGAETELLLHGIFRGLVAYKVPLGLTDYLDGIRALRLGFGQPREGVVGREELLALCRRLWARTPDEVRLLHRLFGDIPLASKDEIEEIEAMEEAGRVPDVAPSGGRTDPDVVSTVTSREPDESNVASDGPRAAIDFQAAAEAGGIPLPPAPTLSEARAGMFVLQPQTVVGERALAVLWRRFRALTRVGAKTELDIDGTVAERCRRGILASAVLRSPRVNSARLLILADSSPSMAPWQPFLDTVARSLVLSGLRMADIHYFNNTPGRFVFRRSTLIGARRTDDVLAGARGAGLLIISDAGSARRHFSNKRMRETTMFLDRASGQARSIVWVNPLPQARWDGTTAAALATHVGAVFLPLDVPSLIKAVDILRGARTR